MCIRDRRGTGARSRAGGAAAAPATSTAARAERPARGRARPLAPAARTRLGLRRLRHLDDDRDAGRLTGARDAAEFLVAGLDPGGERRDARVLHQPGHVALLVGQHERDDTAGLPGARGAAAAVEVVLVVGGRVHVDDQVQIVDVDAPRRHVRRDERGDLAVLELVQRPVALRLGTSAVQGRGAHTAGEEPLREAVGAALGVHEHDHATVAGRDAGGHGLLVRLVRHVQHVVLHGGDGAGRRVDRVHDRVGEEHLDQPVDVLVEGRREQHPLPVRLDLLEECDDLRHEAHVGHLVGLVQDGDGHRVQSAVTALDEVLEAAGRGDQDFGTAAQRTGLPADRHAADDGGDAQVHGGRVRGQRVGDLLGEFPGGDEDERQRGVRLGAASRGAGEQREAEGQGLARAGAAAAEDVTAGQRVREGGALDGEGLGHALRGECLQQRGGHVEGVERLDGGERGGDGLRQGELAALGRCGPAARRGTARAPGVRLRPVRTAPLYRAVAGRSVLAFGAGHTELPSWGIPGITADCCGLLGSVRPRMHAQSRCPGGGA